jgi:hypothetical protein
MDKVRKPSNSVCYTPSSEPSRIYRPVYIWEHNVSGTGLYLRLQVKPTQLGPIDRASPFLRAEDGEKIQSPKRLCFEI